MTSVRHWPWQHVSIRHLFSVLVCRMSVRLSSTTKPQYTPCGATNRMDNHKIIVLYFARHLALNTFVSTFRYPRMFFRNRLGLRPGRQCDALNGHGVARALSFQILLVTKRSLCNNSVKWDATGRAELSDNESCADDRKLNNCNTTVWLQKSPYSVTVYSLQLTNIQCNDLAPPTIIRTGLTLQENISFIMKFLSLYLILNQGAFYFIDGKVHLRIITKYFSYKQRRIIFHSNTSI